MQQRMRDGYVTACSDIQQDSQHAGWRECDSAGNEKRAQKKGIRSKFRGL